VIRPKSKIRRFDVFAEFTRLEKLQEGMSSDEAKGYAIWLAKVVAARKFGRLKPEPERRRPPAEEEAARRAVSKYRALGGVEQTDQVFDHDIIERMGRGFYQKVFSPAVREAFKDGKSYRQIRDQIRKGWQPEPGPI
jgi:hypothetical protein